ncbi:MAG TPA: DNA polymerase III subunit gamma/tau [Dehalococcoidia bacterium]|nr:DNA polymerase III subunit gamma/tau [Dehalococcoidia bacterium]
MLYRKWRPRSFEEVAGQEHVAATLKNALASGRVAHAYLFSGARGTGKTTTGRLMAKALNCRNRVDGEPCNTCESCRDYLDGRAMDLIEMDAASNRGIEEIRSLRDKVAYHPSSGEFKVYLIDEVHMLTDAAFNALLKTLEEPPPHVVFILATTEAHKLPATISSRCQRFDFRRAPLTSMVRNLQRICAGEGFTVEPAALELIARSATGSHRDAVNLLDQLATSYGKDLTVEHVRAGLGLIGDERAGQLARLSLAGDLAGGLTLIGSVRDDGLDLRQFQRELVDELRALLMVKNGIEPSEGATQERMQELRNAVKDIPTPTLLTALKAFGEADLKADPNSTLPLDIALAECAMAIGQSGNQATGQVAANGPSSNQPVRQSSPAAAPVRPEPVEGRAPTARPEALEGPAPTARPEALEGPASTARPETHEEPAPTARPEALEGPTRTARPETHEGPAPTARPEALEGPAAEPPQPVSIASSEPVGASLEAARAQMRPLYERAKSAGFQLGALLNSGCDIIEAGESSIVIGFRHANHANKASEKANLDALAAIASEVMGRPTSVSCVHDPEIEAWTQRQPPNRSALVRAAQEMGGRILSSEPEDPA